MVSREYQLRYSKGKEVLKNVAGRSQKFRKILGVMKDFCPHTESLSCLDMGCSNGIIASFLGDYFLRVTGIDIDEEAIPYAHAHYGSPRVRFLVGDSMALPLRSGTMDVIVCNHIYEHVPDARRMMEEIHRVLKEKGFCYFAAGNKHMITEGHYHLPFLSWLPKRAAHLYLRWTGRGNVYYEEHLSFRGLKDLVRRFTVHDYTLSIIRDPQKYSASDLFDTNSLLYRLMKRVAPYLYPLIPTYVWILTKK